MRCSIILNARGAVILSLSAFCVAFFANCSRMEVTGENCYPPGSDWKTCQFRLVVEVDGQYGKSFNDETRKDVHLRLFNGTQKCFTTNDVASGADISWQVEWLIKNKIVKVSMTDRVNSGKERHIKTYEIPLPM